MEATRRMTWAEIAAAYPDEWVLLAETEYEDPIESLEVRRARVLAHGDDHDQVRADLAWQSTGDLAFFFTGEITMPEGTGVVL